MKDPEPGELLLWLLNPSTSYFAGAPFWANFRLANWLRK